MPDSDRESQTWSSQNLPWGRGGGNVVFHINGRQNRDGELLFHQPGAEIRSGSFPYSGLGWGPHKSIKKHKKHTTVLVTMGKVPNWELPLMARVASNG